MKTRSLKRFHFSFKTFALLFLCVTLLTGLLPENVSAASSIGLSAYAPKPGSGTITISWNKVSNASFYAYSVRDTTTNASICDRVQTSKAYAKVSHTWEAGHSYRVWAGACCEGNDPDNTSTWDYTGMTTFTVEACAHSHTETGWDINYTITCTPISDTQHKMKGYEYEYCTNCFEHIGSSYKATWTFEHDFDENGDCPTCGYKHACEHTRTKLVEIDGYPAYIQDSETKHIVDIQYKRVCRDCDAVVDKLVDSERVYQREDHDFNSKGVCRDCGYVKSACQHPSTEIAWDTSRAITYKSVSDQMHTMTGYQYKYCTVCFEHVGDSFSASETVSHNFDSNGDCPSCGYTHACPHTKTKQVENTSKRTSSLKPFSETEHEVTTTKYYELVCATCDAYISGNGSETTTEKQPHNFGSGTTCSCGYVKTEEACQHTKTKRVENTGKRATKLTPKSETEHEVTTTKYYELHCAACNVYIRNDDSEKTTVAKPHDFGNGNTCACGYKKVTKTETTKEVPYVLGFSMSETEIEVGNTVTFTLNIANAKDGAKLAIEMCADDQFIIKKEVTVKNGKASCTHEFSNTGNRSIKFRVAGGEYCAAKTLKVLSKKPGESKIIKVAVVPPINAACVEKKDGETFAVSVVCNTDTVCVEMYFGKEHNQDTYRSSSNYVEANGTRTFTLTYTLGGNGKRYAGDYPITVSPFSYVDADWTKNQMGATANAGTLKVTHDMNGDEQCIACGYAGKWVDPGKDGNWKTKAPNVIYPNKDDKMLTCDETGEIRYVEQKWNSGNSERYRDDYWTGVDQSKGNGKCTRAAASMALSYMGIDVLPKDMGNHCKTGYKEDASAKDSSCNTRGASTDYAGSEYKMNYDEFLDLYNDYASDEEGNYSPVVIHTVRWIWSKDDKKFVKGTHAFIVVGHDQSDPDYFYVVDPGHGNNDGTGRIKLTQEGQMRVADYQWYNGKEWVSFKDQVRYTDDCNLIGVWQYYKEG